MILVLGATGFLGKNLCDKLSSKGIVYVKTSKSLGLDLLDKELSYSYFSKIKPTAILNCAAHVGGISYGYTYPADLFSKNIQMILNILDLCKQFNVKRLINPISNCTYPAKLNLFKEENFWDGPLHDSVLAYGLARKALCVGSMAYKRQYNLDVINLIFSNMYGPGDHFDEKRSHALGAIIMKIVRAHIEKKHQVTIWGSGDPVREWLHVEDASEVMIRALNIAPYEDIINIGIASGISIKDLAFKIKQIVGYAGDLFFDVSRPDGAIYKTVDGSIGNKIFDWVPEKNFDDGLQETINWYKKYGIT